MEAEWSWMLHLLVLIVSQCHFTSLDLEQNTVLLSLSAGWVSELTQCHESSPFTSNIRFEIEQGWWTSRSFRAHRITISVFSKLCSGKAAVFRLWTPVASNRLASILSVLYIVFLANIHLGKTTTTKTTGPSLNKVFKPLILVQPSHFINDVTEVQGGGACDLSKFIWLISERAEMGNHVSWPGKLCFPWLPVNYFWVPCGWPPQLDCRLPKGRMGLDTFLVLLLAHCLVAPCWRIRTI